MDVGGPAAAPTGVEGNPLHRFHGMRRESEICRHPGALRFETSRLSKRIGVFRNDANRIVDHLQEAP